MKVSVENKKVFLIKIYLNKLISYLICEKEDTELNNSSNCKNFTVKQRWLFICLNVRCIGYKASIYWKLCIIFTKPDQMYIIHFHNYFPMKTLWQRWDVGARNASDPKR